MGKRSNLTAAELDLIAELTEEAGLSAAQIARRVGCSVGSVTWAQLRIGADRRPTRALPPVPVERKTVMRGNHVVTSYSAEDDAALQAMALAGLCDGAIGRALNPPRRPNSVRGRLMTLARRAERREAADLATIRTFMATARAPA